MKTARSQKVWDVCRTAAAFCLLYDDARWIVKRSKGKSMIVPFFPLSIPRKKEEEN